MVDRRRGRGARRALVHRYSFPGLADLAHCCPFPGGSLGVGWAARMGIVGGEGWGGCGGGFGRIIGGGWVGGQAGLHS